MKCIHCLLCLEIIRLDVDLYYYCDLCRRIYRRENYRAIELEEEKAKEVLERYLRIKKESQNVG